MATTSDTVQSNEEENKCLLVSVDCPCTTFHVNHINSVRYLCTFCGELFQKEQLFREHRRDVHNIKVAKILKCPHCSARFSRKQHLDRHMRNYHSAYVKGSDWRCLVCNTSYISSRSLSRHIGTDTHKRKGKQISLFISRSNGCINTLSASVLCIQRL